jgi:hypothetical protein
MADITSLFFEDRAERGLSGERKLETEERTSHYQRNRE